MDGQDAVVAMVPSSLFARTLGAARRMASRTHDAGDQVGAARRVIGQMKVDRLFEFVSRLLVDAKGIHQTCIFP